MTIMFKLAALMTPKERVHAQILLAMILIMALLDAVGVASIMPFMALITNPDLIDSNPLLEWLYRSLNAPTKQHFLLITAALMFVFLLISLIFKALTTYFQIRLTQMHEYSIGKRLVEGYIHQPYSWFLTRNSTDLGKTILSDVTTVINNGMLPFITVIAQSAVVSALLLLLLMVNSSLALTVGFVLGAIYGLIFKYMNKSLTSVGQDCFANNSKRFMAVSEAFSAVKEVKIGDLEATYVKRFANAAERYARSQSVAQVIILLPRFVLEAIAFGGMMLIVIYLMLQGSSFSDALPIISLYAFAGYRLVPALQQIYGALSQLRVAGPAISALETELSNSRLALASKVPTIALEFKNSITLNNIHYAYPDAVRAALDGMSLYIPARKVIGLVGSTGCGKTTTVDLILGLLAPQQGTLCVDGAVLNSTNVRQWQKIIGYVPQQIYLADDSVASNIAFGIDQSSIDRDAVICAAKVASLHEFVVNELPMGYDTKVGERGVRLSGGQRQRIGIARALYHKPQVLILDEATSALDNLTELVIMDAINKLRNDSTIILIAHRLSTVKECDLIYLMEKGKVIAQGGYDQLRESSKTFHNMTKVLQ